jgi:hypothetical protein
MMMVRLYHECCPRRCCRCRCRGRLEWPCYCLHTIGTRWSTRNATAGSPERVVPPQQRKRSGAVGDKISDPFYMAIEHQKSSETSILGFSTVQPNHSHHAEERGEDPETYIEEEGRYHCPA